MKRNGWVIACASLLALTGCSSAPPDTHDADVKAIQATESAWAKDASTKDLEKFVAYYADEASVLLPNAPIFSGKDAIRGGLKPVLSDPNFAVNWSSVKTDVAKSGELGYSQGTYTMTSSDPKTNAAMTEKGKYLTVYRKQPDGNWRAVEDTFMADAPAVPAAK